MGNEGRIKQHPRRTSLANSVEIERQVEDLLQRGIVKKSNSPWFSPEVQKKMVPNDSASITYK